MPAPSKVRGLHAGRVQPAAPSLIYVPPTKYSAPQLASPGLKPASRKAVLGSSSGSVGF